MKKLIVMAFCFALAIAALTGCRGNRDTQTIDTTTTPSTVSTTPTTKATEPTTQATEPSTPNAGDSNGAGSTNGGNGNAGNSNGGMDGNMGNGNAQSRAHIPSIVGRNR